MTIISSEVDSPSTWVRPRKIVRAGTKRMPPPTPTRPPAKPPAKAIRSDQRSPCAGAPVTRESARLRSRPAERRRGRETARWEMRCWIAVPDDDAGHGRDREPEAGEDVDVAVDPALGERSEQADEDDRREAGAGGEPLAEAEPEDQQGHDDRAAADAEEPLKTPARVPIAASFSVRCEGRRQVRGHRAAILDAVSRRLRDRGARRRPNPVAGSAARTPPARRSSPTSTAPWRRSSSGPSWRRCRRALPSCSRALSERYGLVGCISGRRALEARRLVGVEGHRLRRQPRLRTAAAGRGGAAARSGRSAVASDGAASSSPG